jgi:acyl carrier protein
MYKAGEFKQTAGIQAQLLFQTLDELLRYYGVTNFSATLFENGVDSLKLSNLIDDARNQFGIEIDFGDAQKVPCKLLHESSNKTAPDYPDYLTIQNPPHSRIMPFYLLAQSLGILALVAIVCVAVIPSVQLYPSIVDYMIAKTTNISIITSCTSIFLVLIWIITYSVLLVLLKWIIIGRYIPSTVALWSFEFFKWWFIDRLVAIWEFIVGVYVIDTPWLNIFYKLMGADVPLLTVRFKVFIREFDLLTAKGENEINGTVQLRVLSTKFLTMDRIVVDQKVCLKSSSVSYFRSEIAANI